MNRIVISNEGLESIKFGTHCAETVTKAFHARSRKKSLLSHFFFFQDCTIYLNLEVGTVTPLLLFFLRHFTLYLSLEVETFGSKARLGNAERGFIQIEK